MRLQFGRLIARHETLVILSELFRGPVRFFHTETADADEKYNIIASAPKAGKLKTDGLLQLPPSLGTTCARCFSREVNSKHNARLARENRDHRRSLRGNAWL